MPVFTPISQNIILNLAMFIFYVQSACGEPRPRYCFYPLKVPKSRPMPLSSDTVSHGPSLESIAARFCEHTQNRKRLRI